MKDADSAGGEPEVEEAPLPWLWRYAGAVAIQLGILVLLAVHSAAAS